MKTTNLYIVNLAWLYVFPMLIMSRCVCVRLLVVAWQRKFYRQIASYTSTKGVGRHKVGLWWKGINYQQNSYLTVIGIHSTIHLMHPNYCQITIMCVCVCVCVCMSVALPSSDHKLNPCISSHIWLPQVGTHTRKGYHAIDWAMLTRAQGSMTQQSR